MEPADKDKRFGGLEMGGTSCKVGLAIGDPLKIVEREVFETKDPALTLAKISSWFNERNIDSLGIVSFGPLCLDKTSDDYGTIMNTPKKEWTKYPLLKKLKENLTKKDINVNMDTDVNGCAYLEFVKGNRHAKENVIYITVGTGVGVGAVINKAVVHGLTHPEGGHMLIPKLESDKGIESNCPFHKSCLEGLITNVALAKSLGIKIEDLPQLKDDHEIWDKVANYMAVACLNITLIISPEVIVLGGGVMQRKILIPKIRKMFIDLLNNYVVHSRLESEIDSYIVQSQFETDNGIIAGALLGTF